ncbi:HTH domain-containing protein [Natronorubrum halophilum]|uniref:HTH domain-containing protein n=1 Tax=Natronorubrum halophilum TaxID=1702106 RepID=UPI000EF6CB8D|nr:HTH domain-containing protein [Natronorubrum halophilum]
MTTPTITTVCHVRAPLLLEPVDRQIETLRACETEGAIDELLLRSWPKEVSLTDNSPYQEALESFDRFEQWAEERGVSIRPPFRERATTSQISGETNDLLVMPLLCLEVYADDELIGVFPHTDEELEETHTTDEAIASLRTGELPTPLGAAGETETRSEPTTGVVDAGVCPDCDGSLIDGQGLFACPDCGWIGTVSESGRYVSQAARERAKESEETPVAPQ